jgi:hemoglobin
MDTEQAQELEAEEASFYQRIGGGPALQLAVSEFYRLVLADEALKTYFANTDMSTLKKHQAALLAGVRLGAVEAARRGGHHRGGLGDRRLAARRRGRLGTAREPVTFRG